MRYEVWLVLRLDADPVAALVRYCSLAVILQVWQFVGHMHMWHTAHYHKRSGMA